MRKADTSGHAERGCMGGVRGRRRRHGTSDASRCRRALTKRKRPHPPPLRAVAGQRARKWGRGRQAAWRCVHTSCSSLECPIVLPELK